MANALLFGFVALEAQDLLNQRAAQTPTIKDMIDLSVAEHNRQANDFIGAWASRTTGYTARFRSNAGGVLQPLDEYGRSRPRKTSTYSIGLPIKMAGDATGYTFVSREKVTVGEVNAILSGLLIADLRWLRRQILGALFDNTAAGVTFADPVYGDFKVYGMANGDAGVTYYNNSSDSAATDTHYLAQANAVSDVDNPFPAIYTEITEHPENSGDVVALIPTSNKAAVTALTEFTRTNDPNINPGANTATVSGFPAASLPPGATPLGYLEDSKVWVAEYQHLPSNYIVASTTGGDNPLAMREDEEASLRGFFGVDRKDEFPYYGEQWVRRAGFGGWNRVGAVIQQVGNGTYSIPTGYSLLMAT